MNRQLALRALRNVCTFIGAIALFSYFYNWSLDRRHWFVTLASAVVCLILWTGFYVIETRGGVAQLAARLSRLRTPATESPSPVADLPALAAELPALPTEPSVTPTADFPAWSVASPLTPIAEPGAFAADLSPALKRPALPGDSVAAATPGPAVVPADPASPAAAPAFESAATSSHHADFDLPAPIEARPNEMPPSAALPAKESTDPKETPAPIEAVPPGETAPPEEPPVRNPLPWLRPRRSRAAVAGKDASE